MKYSFSLLTACCILLISCSENAKDTKTDTAITIDSIKIQNQVYAKGLVSLSSEKDISKLLCQNWEMEDDLDVIKDNGDAEGNYPFRSFALAPDFTYIRNPRNYMEYGNWAYDDAKKTITLKNSAGGKDEYKIAAIGPTELIVINSGAGSVTKLKFISSGKVYADINNDPYCIENNRWRIKPKTSESDEEVRKRLKACLRFYILFYKDNLAKDQKTISFYGFPTCLRWYRGGIKMVKKDDLASNWFGCYYNKEQALKAYKLVEDVIMKKYNWPKEKMSWVKMNLLVLEQIEANI